MLSVKMTHQLLKSISTILLLVLSSIATAQSQSESSVDIVYSQGSIDLTTINSPLGDVLDAFADETGIEINYLVDTATLPRVSLELNKVSVAQSLEILLKDINQMTLSQSGAGSEGEKLPKQIWVLGTDESRQQLSVIEQPEYLSLAAKQRSKMLLHFINKKALSEDELVDILSQSLKTDHNALVRTRAAMGLTKLNQEKSVPALIQALSDGNESVRNQVVLALAKIGNDQALTALGGVLTENADPVERTIAVRALRNLDSDIARYYLDLAGYDSDGQVRNAVVPDKPLKKRSVLSAVNDQNTQ